MTEEQIREEYLATLSTGKYKQMKTAFNILRRYANTIGAPILKLSSEDILSAVNQHHFTTPSTVRGYVGALDMFFQWAKQYQYCEKNPMEHVSYHDVDFVSACKIRLTYNIQWLLRTLRLIGQPEDGYAVYPIVIFAWIGMSTKEASVIPRSAIDLLGGHVQTQEILTFDEISQDLLLVLQKYDSCTKAIRDNGIPMVPGDRNRFIYRMEFQNQNKAQKNNTPLDLSATLGMATAKLLEHNNQTELRYADLVQSGRLFKAYGLELRGYDFSSKEGALFLQKLLRAPAAYPGDAQLIYDAYKKAFSLE